MNASEIIEQFRRITGDDKSPYLWSDEELYIYLNEAVIEACRRGRLKKTSDFALGEVKSSSNITLLTGNYGFISVVSIEGINILTNAVPYTSDLNTTATLLATEITNSGKFTATSNNNVITVKPIDGLGSSLNGIVPVVSTSGIGVWIS